MLKLTKVALLSLTLVLLIALLGCSGSKGESTDKGGTVLNNSSGTADQPATNASSSGDKVKITVVSSWNQLSLPNWPDLVKEFNDSHPGIVVKLEFINGESAVQKLRSQFVSGTAPELVHVWKKDLNEYVDNGILTDLTDLYKEAGWDEGYFNPGALKWEAAIKDIKANKPPIYGVPDFLQPSVIYYNVPVFKKLNLEEPTNIDELIAVSAKIKAAGIKPLVLNAAEDNGLDIMAKAQAQFAGIQPLLDINEGKGKFTDKPMMDTAKAIERLIKEGVIDPESVGLDQTAAVSLFANGQAAMYSLHSSIIPNLEEIKKQNPDFDYSVLKELNFTDSPVAKYSATFGGSWVVPKSNKHVKETYEFMKFIFSKEHAQQTANLSGKLSDIESANYGFSNPVITKISENMVDSINEDSFYLIDMVPSKVLESLRSGLQEMINGKIDAETMMKNTQKVMDDILAGK